MKNFDTFKKDIENVYQNKYSDILEVTQLADNVIDTKINGKLFTAFNLENSIKLFAKVNAVYNELTFTEYVADRINNKIKSLI